MDKKKKITLIAVGVVETLILIFALVVSIIVLAKQLPAGTDASVIYNTNGPFIGWFQTHFTYFFLIIVLPVLVIFLGDAVYLIVYAVKKPSALSDEERAAIEAKAKEEARKEIEAEMAAEKKPADPEQK